MYNSIYGDVWSKLDAKCGDGPTYPRPREYIYLGNIS
jgi:hypothetical protein